ncbi:MAG: Franean1_4349 family RiPP [Desulfuromonadales bacterium]
MSQDSVERLLGRLVTDASMRADIVASPESVCRREGYDLTEGEMRLVVKMNIAIFEPAASGLDPSLCRSGTMTKWPHHGSSGKR